MQEDGKQADVKVQVEVGVTTCPECGAEWETVVTLRPRRADPIGSD